MMSATAGLLVSGGDPTLVNVAATMGANAAVNNQLRHAQRVAFDNARTSLGCAANSGSAACQSLGHVESAMSSAQFSLGHQIDWNNPTDVAQYNQNLTTIINQAPDAQQALKTLGLAPVALMGIGLAPAAAVAAGVVNAGAQAIQNNGTVDPIAVIISTATAGAGGVVAKQVTSIGANVVIGATSNTAGYVGTQIANNQEVTVDGATKSAVSGAVGSVPKTSVVQAIVTEGTAAGLDLIYGGK